MKLLGKLNASSLVIGDLIEVSGFLSVVTSVFVDGVKVIIETDKLHPFELCRLDEIKVYSSFNQLEKHELLNNKSGSQL